MIMSGMTLKQFARAEFWAALDIYKQALATGKNIVPASARIHAALGRDGVPKRFKSFVTRARRQTK